MRLGFAVAAAFVLSAFSAFADDGSSLIAVRKEPIDPVLAIWKLEITSKADKLEITKLTINRGCNIDRYVRLPIILKYGQTYSLDAIPCNPIEVSIETPDGTHTMTWFVGVTDKLSVQKYLIQGIYWATFVTSLVDNITIRSVNINRGNCPNIFRLDLPDTPKNLWNLKFGQRVMVDSQQCKPLAVDVKTDQGDMNFDFSD
jgi:hypothetical protein